MNTLKFEKNNGIGLLTVNRPESLNALSFEALSELETFLNTEQNLRVLILTGAGEKAFIAGADVKEMQSSTSEQIERFITLGQKVTELLENSSFVTIAAVNGYALGGGLEMALACDFIYAAESAKLGLPEVKLGLIPGFGGSQRLPLAVGERLAREMIFTGKHIPADEAHIIGLVNKVCPADELINACKKTAEVIAGYSEDAIIQAKRAMSGPYSLEREKKCFIEVSGCLIKSQ